MRERQDVPYLLFRGPPLTPAPRRAHYWVATFCYTVALLYGSWLPLRFEEISLRQGVETFRDVLTLSGDWLVGTDFSFNILLAIPLGYLLIQALCTDRSSWTLWLGIPTAAALCAGVCLAAEFGQVWIVDRSSSLNDLKAQGIGTLVGVALGAAAGPRLTRAFRDLMRPKQSQEALLRLLQLYTLALLTYSVIPLDWIQDRAELRHRWEAVTAVPPTFEDRTGPIAAVAKAMIKAGLWAPLGVLCVIAPRRGDTPLWPRLLTSFAIVGLIEIAQFYLRSHVANVLDLAAGMLGVTGGAVLLRYFDVGVVLQNLAGGKRKHLRRFIAGATLLYACGLLALFWYPFQLERDVAVVQRHAREFVSLPFVRLWEGSELNAVSQTTRKCAAFAVLGGLTAFSLSAAKRTTTEALFGRAALAGLLLGGLVEVGQIFFAGRIADVFDIVMCGVGSGVGGLVGGTILQTGFIGAEKRSLPSSKPAGVRGAKRPVA